VEPGTTYIVISAPVIHVSAQQLDMEKTFISSISTSLANISRRSPNFAFQESYNTRLRVSELTLTKFND
jgi:hypothetical protein